MISIPVILISVPTIWLWHFIDIIFTIKTNRISYDTEQHTFHVNSFLKVKTGATYIRFRRIRLRFVALNNSFPKKYYGSINNILKIGSICMQRYSHYI